MFLTKYYLGDLIKEHKMSVYVALTGVLVGPPVGDHWEDGVDGSVMITGIFKKIRWVNVG